MGTVSTLPGCTLSFTDETLAMIAACATYARLRGLDVQIAHGTDGKHSGAADPHPFGKALDIRLHDQPDHEGLLSALQHQLGDRYTVIIEDDGTPNEHVHAQLRKDLWPQTVPQELLASARSQDANRG